MEEIRDAELYLARQVLEKMLDLDDPAFEVLRGEFYRNELTGGLLPFLALSQTFDATSDTESALFVSIAKYLTALLASILAPCHACNTTPANNPSCVQIAAYRTQLEMGIGMVDAYLQRKGEFRKPLLKGEAAPECVEIVSSLEDLNAKSLDHLNRAIMGQEVQRRSLQEEVTQFQKRLKELPLDPQAHKRISATIQQITSCSRVPNLYFALTYLLTSHLILNISCFPTL